MTLFEFYQDELVSIAHQISKIEQELDSEHYMISTDEELYLIHDKLKSGDYSIHNKTNDYIFTIEDKAILVEKDSIDEITSLIENKENEYLINKAKLTIELTSLECKAKYLIEALNSVVSIGCHNICKI